ncbi:MAG TPA: zinc transporter ZupT [Spirochaetota bacterium]|nr:zinc transporter ZupT [Spirochaetota bacterium]
METSNVLFAFGLTLFAGLSTGVGSLMVLMSKKFNPRFLAASLGFSAGVMIYVSLVEIFAKARVSLAGVYGDRTGYWFTVLAFFAGMAFITIIDRMVPSFENPHEIANIHEMVDSPAHGERKLLRMGIFSAIAIGIHNFPEGLATFIGALTDPAMGVSIAVAIAIHNIPEGIAVALPVYYATKSRGKAFLISASSGFAEPVGAILGYVLLRNFLPDLAFGWVFAAVAGIMVYISLDELLPTAEEYGEHHIAMGGLIGGMLVMSLSLVLFV